MEIKSNPRDIEYLRNLKLFQGVPVWTLETVVNSVEDVKARKGQLLLERGTDDGYTYFLLDGQVTLDSGEGEKREMSVRPENLPIPVNNLRPRLFSVSARSQIIGFRIPDLVITSAVASAPTGASKIAGDEDEKGTKLRALEQKLGFLLYRDLQEEKSVLPSLPDLALKIQTAIEDKKSDAKAIAKWLEQDPAMTAKIVRTANSALYARRGLVETCSAAIVRLGTRVTQKLILSFCAREVFHSRKPGLNQRMQALWSHCADVAAISYVLAQRARGFSHDPEEAMLAGLLHDVGTIVVLNYAQNMPSLMAEPAVLDEIIRRLRGELGAMILRTWRFTPEIVAASRDAEDWLRKRKGLADITDVVIVAQMHDHLSKNGLDGLPPVADISAMNRVLGRQVTPEASIEIIKEAQAQIADVRTLLDG